MSTRELKALQDAHLAIKKAEGTMIGAVKLYGTLDAKAAQSYHALAHAAFDQMLDAERATHRHLEEIIRKGGAS